MKNLAKCWKLNIFTIIMSVSCIRGSNLTVEERVSDSNSTDSIQISLLPESDSPLIISEEDKPILRFGFHRTYDCQNFEKAFICVRKCLDLNYQIAHADKKCVCTCHKNSVLAKYKGPTDDTDSEKWKLGAPTTLRPVWAGGIVEKKPNDYEINANYTEFIGYPKEPIVEHEEEEEEPAAEDSSETTPADDDATPNPEDDEAAEAAEGSGAETTTPEPEE